MTTYSLAVDIGASSGRVMLGYQAKSVLQLEELHRFPNGLVKRNGYDCWDVERLFNEIKIGVHKCKGRGIVPASIGIDTWAVDFVLLDENDQLLTEAIAYRDPRTDGMMEDVFKTVSKERLYLETGIQFQKFNTIYQLMALKKKHPEVLEKATSFLMIPDYFNFLLTGVKANEYTNATSTQLVNAFTKRWDQDLIRTLGLRPEMFEEIKLPKTVLGNLLPELTQEFGFDMKVVLPATHDTGSAVVSIPEEADSIYISSGTWSLIGVENHFPICVTKALDYNFTNEGGMDYRFRFLKNIMGMWMIQEVKRHLKEAYSYAKLVELAKDATCFHTLINVDEDRFLNPENMIAEIQVYCVENELVAPETPGELAKCIYESLVASYQKAIDEIEEIFERSFKNINVIGGGCQNELLNQWIADVTGKVVTAGPVEATAIGNIVAQQLALEEIGTLEDARKLVKRSFPIKTYLKQEA